MQKTHMYGNPAGAQQKSEQAAQWRNITAAVGALGFFLSLVRVIVVTMS